MPFDASTATLDQQSAFDPSTAREVEQPSQHPILSGIAAGLWRAVPKSLSEVAGFVGGTIVPSAVHEVATAGRMIRDVASGETPAQAAQREAPEVMQQGAALRGEYGTREQAAGWTGIGLQAAMLALPFVKPIRAKIRSLSETWRGEQAVEPAPATAAATTGEVIRNAEQPSHAQVEKGPTTFGQQARPESQVVQPSVSDNVVREAQGEAPGGQVSQVAPAPVAEAAVRLPDGKVYTGVTHADAMEKAVTDGYARDTKVGVGYTDRNGQYLNRIEAENRAADVGQIQYSSGEGLEAEDFARIKRVPLQERVRKPQVGAPSVQPAGVPVSEAGQAPAVAGQPRIISTAVQTPQGIIRGEGFEPHDSISARVATEAPVATPQGIQETQKGFIIREPDGTERFTNDRVEAARVANASGQVKPENAGTTELHSQQLQEAPMAEATAETPAVATLAEQKGGVPPADQPAARALRGTPKVSRQIIDTAVSALRAMDEPKSVATERVNAAIRDLAQSGEKINLDNVVRRALQRNVPQVIEVGSPREIPITELEGRAMGAAGTREIPLRGWKDMIDAGEQPALNPTAEQAAPKFIGNVLNTVSGGIRNMRDFITVEPVPKMMRAGLGDAAYEHAAARNSVVHSVRHLLSRVFPDEYKNPDLMRTTGDILTKDNILGVYDQAKARFEATINPQTTAAEIEHNAAGKAMKAIGEAHDLTAYDRDVRAAGSDPNISANINRWKQWVNPEMDRMYNEIKGYDPWTIQEPRGRYFEARINLLPKEQAGMIGTFTDANKAMPDMPTSNYRNPNVKKDPFMRQAKGTGQYETDPGLILTNSLARRWNEITKIRLYEAVQKSGNGFVTEPGERPPVREIGGEPLARMSIKMPETNEQGLTRIVEKSLWIKKSLVRETRDVLNTDLAAPSNPVFRALTQLQLLQAVDMTAHMKNIHTVVANSLGANRAWVDAVRKIPGLATADTVGRIAAVTKEVMADTPAIRDEIAQMARQGMIRPAYPPTGIQKITRGQQMIHSVDTASRIVMNRFWDNLVERGMVNDSMQGRRAFVNQIGEYNRRLLGHFARNMRDYGLSPFVVAGRTFNRFSKRLLIGDPGFKAATPQAALAARAYQLSGLTLAVTLPAIVNYITTGNFGGRPGTPIGAIDTGTNNAKGDKRIIDILQLMGIRRGLRGTGAGAVIEGLREGKSFNEISGKAIEDITSTASHPWLGPGLGAVYSGLTGKRLDLRGGGWPYIAKRKKEGGLEQYKENFRVTLKNQNPLIYGLIAPLIGETDDTYTQGLSRGFLRAPAGALGFQEKPGSSAFSTRRPKGQKAVLLQ